MKDGLIDIAIGKSRMDKQWKNKELLWSEFVARVRKTHRTHETYKEYINSKPDRQDNIKDIGGFVGGHILGGRRKNGAITHRTLITLDIDFGDENTWSQWAVTGYTSCLYSTHKHSKDNPRYRLVLPVDRPVTVEEYEAISRKVASWLDINIFDPTTFQATRLMYWPSTSKDGEFVFQETDGEWLSADEVLAMYDDWKDTSQWAYHKDLDDSVHRDIKEQGDPLLKPGLIGAFCRSHTIQEAIRKYLPLIYEATEDENRYTYILGTTANGLVIYNDKFCYSHHSSDPIGMKLCNAWDMVRLHKFGSLDKRSKEDTRPQDLLSFKAMSDLIAEDRDVKKQIGKEKLEHAREVFGPRDESEEKPERDDWMEAMEVDKSGNYVSTINNVILILDNDPMLQDCFGYNAFTVREVMLRDLPWRQYNPKQDGLMDSDDAALRHYLEYTYGIVGPNKIADGLAVITKKNSFHPVRDYLDSLAWDGKKRLDTLFIDYLGCSDSRYIRAISRKTLIAAVARMMDPGCKFDHCLVLIGEQGKGKSTFINRLGQSWYSDSFMGVQGTQSLEQLQGVWIMEIAELSGFRKADVESIKHFISKQSDEYRQAYGKRKEIFHRQIIFIGTTNDTNFLKDPTRNRRFWPVTVTMDKGFNRLTKDVVDQVWAEAAAGYLEGEKLYLDAATEAEAEAVQESHMEEDSRIGIVEKFLDIFLPDDWKEKSPYEKRGWLQAEADQIAAEGKHVRMQVSAIEVYCECFGGTTKDMTTYLGREYMNILKRVNGWKFLGKQKRVAGYGRQVVFERVIDNEDLMG